MRINPDRPKDEPTPSMQFGSALHAAVLEPNAFLDRYACAINPEEYPGMLDTMEELRGWLKEHGVQPKGTRKEEVIAQVRLVTPEVPIFAVLKAQHAAENQGKVIFSVEDWARIYACAKALRDEPALQKLLSDPAGQFEVKLSAVEPETGVLLRSKQDWVTQGWTLDLKTFVQKRDKSLDRSIADAIYYEDYLRQAWVYTTIRQLQPGASQKAPPSFALAFVESDPPHEVRIRVLRPTTGGEANVYWMRSQAKAMALIRLYANCVRIFGTDPWRSPQEMDPLIDDEMPQLSFER
jgi:hypothetical protein